MEAAAHAVQPRHLSSIEVCRGLAAVMVLTSHSSVVLGAPADFGFRPYGPYFQFGRSGVDFFFVLSGFLISLLHWKDIGRPNRLNRYTLRRLTRIYPTYWLVLLAVVPYDIFVHTLFDNYDRPFEVLKSVFLLPQEHTILDVTWSLRNELLFYLLFGIAIFNRWAGLAVLSAWMLAFAVMPFTTRPIENDWIRLITFPMNFEFLAGVAAGWAFPRLPIPRPAALLALGLAGFACLWIGEDFFWPAHLSWNDLALRCLGYGAAAVSVLLGLSALEVTHRVRMPRLLITLGGASYLLYLVHVPALLLLGATERHVRLTRLAPAWAITAVFDLLIVMGAVVLHLSLEKPILRAVRRQRSGTPIPPESAPV